MTQIISEVFPLTMLHAQVQVIRPSQADGALAWFLPHRSGLHPTSEVLQQISAFFGPIFNARTAVIHSTSWRYEETLDGEGFLILTYVVILPAEDWLQQWLAERRIALAPVGELESVQGDHIWPPASIKEAHVLAHALDHLALLVETDQAIRNLLLPAWEAVLHSRRVRPGGYLPRKL